MKKKQQNRASSKAEALATATERDYAHSSTDDINRRRSSLEYDVQLCEEAMTTLQMKLADTRATIARYQAQITGLIAVLGKR